MTNDRKARAARAEQARLERERAERRKRTTLTLAAVVGALVLVLGVAWGLSALGGDDAADGPVVEPRNVTSGGVQHPGAARAGAPVVEVYEDFLCSHCADFEAEHGAWLADRAERGDIVLRFMPMTILDGTDGTGPAHDAMNAAFCVADAQGAEAFWAMKSALFRAGYASGDEEPSETALAALAQDAGVPGADACVQDGRFVPWLNEARDAARERDVTGTPSVFVDGERLDDVFAVRSAVEDALAS
ncbi:MULTISPECIES: DsbA family protein [Aeromicrobium]|uniref:DsbA family protein n=1 Tax=Aeromicrobium TaxID=2040 RepID=UPI00257E0AAA|nr:MULTISPECIES: thioredoxin domain-containing protein [Aeromicrobium]